MATLKLKCTCTHTCNTYLSSQKPVLVKDVCTMYMVWKQAKCVLHFIFLLTNVTLNVHPCLEH